jgi:hypothetical protein
MVGAVLGRAQSRRRGYGDVDREPIPFGARRNGRGSGGSHSTDGGGAGVNIAILLLALRSLVPANDFEFRPGCAEPVAGAIAEAVTAENSPIFASLEIDEAVLLVIAREESRFRRDAVGDGGKSLGVFELKGTSRHDAFDLRAAARIAYARLRESAAACPDAPLAVYASGSCTNRTGRRISAQRMAEARKVVDVAAVIQ